MAQRETRFDKLMKEYGVVNGDKLFATMESFEAKQLIYTQLFKEVKRALGTGQKSIMGGVKKFTTQFVESELVKNANATPEEVFAKIVAASEKNWGSYPDVKTDTKTRKTYYTEFKGFTEEVTAEDIDEKFAQLLSFAADVKNVVDVYRKINIAVVDRPMDANNQLNKLVEATGAETSPEIQQVTKLIENYRYEEATKIAKKALTAVNKANAERRRERDLEERAQSREVRYESAFMTYRRLGSIAHFVEEGHDKRNTYTQLMTEVNNFVKMTRLYESHVHTAYTNALKDENVNLFFENPNIDFEKVEKFISAIENAEQQLLDAGFSLDSLVIDKKGRVDVEALTTEMEKFTVRRATSTPQNREEFINSAVKSFEILQRITEDKEAYHAGDDKLVRDFISARDAVIADSGIYQLIADGKADKVSDKDMQAFYERMDKVSNQIMNGGDDVVAPVDDKDNARVPVKGKDGVVANPKKDNKGNVVNPVDNNNDPAENSGAFGITPADVDGWRAIGRGGRRIEPATGKGPLTVTSKDFDPTKPASIKAEELYNDPGLVHAMDTYGHLRNIITLLNSMKLPSAIKDFYNVYYKKLVENTNFQQNYAFAKKKGVLKLEPEKIAEIRRDMVDFVGNMGQIEADFKARGLEISKMVNSTFDEKTKTTSIEFNPEEFNKFLTSYTSQPVNSSPVLERGRPDLGKSGRDGLVSSNGSQTTGGEQSTVNKTPKNTKKGGNGIVSNVDGEDVDNLDEANNEGGENPKKSTTSSKGASKGSSTNSSNGNNSKRGSTDGRNSSDDVDNVDEASDKANKGEVKKGSSSSSSGEIDKKGSSNSNGSGTSKNTTKNEKASTKGTADKTNKDNKNTESSNKNELPKVKKDGVLKGILKWIARRPVITATILLAAATPIVGAVASGFLPSFVLWGGIVGLGVGGNALKAITKGVFPGYKRFILNYDIDKRRKKLESAQERSRQIMKDVDSILAKRDKSREDIRKYARVEELQKPKKEKVAGYKEMESYEKGKNAKKAKQERKELVEKADRTYAEELKQYTLRKKANEAFAKVGTTADQKLALKKSGLDITGLNAAQIREIVRLGTELTIQERIANKHKKKITKKMDKVIRQDEKLGGDYTYKDSELQRQIRDSEAIADERARELAVSVGDMGKNARLVPKALRRSGVGRYIDSKLGAYAGRTEAVDKKIEKAETEAMGVIDRYIESHDTQAALDYIADDMLANNGVANERYLARIKQETGTAGLQYIKAKYMELNSGMDDTASSVIYNEISGKGKKKESDMAMAELYGKSFYNDGLDEAEVKERIKKLSPEAQNVITKTFKEAKDKDDRLM